MAKLQRANGRGPDVGKDTNAGTLAPCHLAIWPLRSPVLLLATITIMNYYDMWVNIKDSRKDLEFAEAVRAYLDYLKGQGMIAGWTLKRRKFGFGPESLGEFNITVWAENLAQLDAAFSHVATRSGEVERLHIPVYAAVTDFKSALWRDFPDPERVRS